MIKPGHNHSFSPNLNVTITHVEIPDADGLRLVHFVDDNDIPGAIWIHHDDTPVAH